MRQLLAATVIALGALATPSVASEVFNGAAALDRVEVTYVRHNRDHRIWEIQRNQEMQERYGRRHRGYDHGYGYGRRHGGPPPWAPAHGRRHHERYERF